ncbi:MAG: peptidylprolyl isomerase [Chitinophagaceae bacterium]|nr:peptidylprolyl isomerase [Chitinophagaceae bacterium]
MKKFLLAAIISGTSLGNTYAQTLFTYGSNPVTEAEFMKVYKKNNAAQKIDYSEQALREYVDLYSLFRMKVKEANDMQIDTSVAVSGEIDNYRRQLAKSFLTDNEMIDRLVKEAYDRSKYEVRVAHILLLTNPASDTAALRSKIDSLYAALSKGKADFAAAAKEFSGDAGSKNTGGDIGYISSLQTVYAFENAAFNTPVGKISAPFRTNFGYHIVKVIDKRPARGEIKVAQVLIATPKSAGEAGIAAAKLKLDSVQNDLKKGASFDKIVEKYSDDKFSKDKNGELPVFGVGRMVPAFDEAAFALKKPGDVSKPIQTEYGFHVIKLIERYPVKPFDSIKKELKSKVDNDSRAQQARDIYFQNVRISNGFKENPAAWTSFTAQLKNIADTGAKGGSFNAKTFSSGGSNTLFTLAGKNYTQDDFVAYAVATTRGSILSGGSKENVFRELYSMYQSKVVNDFQEHKLVDENPEFRSLLQEYKDGIMLFELMDRNVWGKASKDTLGLKAFYETKKNNYMWDPGFRGSVYTFKNEAAMKEGLKLLAKKDMKNEELVKTLNTEQNRDAVTIQVGRYEFGKFSEVPQSKIVAGKTSEGIKKADGTYVVVKADEVYTQPVAKSFTEARGYIISAYQDKLEKDWNSELRSKYPVKVNEDEFKKLVH